MKTYQRHGIMSLGLVVAALAVAAIVLFRAALQTGLLYLAFIAIGGVVILYIFCAKCSFLGDCGHVWPGRMAGVFKHRPSGPYTPMEWLVTGLCGLVLIGFPQYWLFRHLAALAAFWLLIAVAVLDIRRAVCVFCDNAHCPCNSRFKN